MCKERLQYIDIAKGISIICIILGHLGLWEINKVVFTFHVPIFFIITGYFINNKQTNIDFIKSRARTLLVPYFVTCIAMVILAALINEIFYGGHFTKRLMAEWLYASVYGAGDSYYEPFYIKAIGAIWFLWASFWGSVFLKISLNMKKGNRLLFIILLFIIGKWSTNLFWFPLSIQAGCCATLYMYIGHLVHSEQEKIKEINIETKAIFTMISLCVWYEFMQNFQSFWLVHCDIGRGVIDIVGSLCGCYMIILLSYYIQQRFEVLSKFLSFLGRYSIFVLCIHIIELNLVPWNRLDIMLSKWGIPIQYEIYIIIVIKLIIAILGVFLCSRSKGMRKVFGYKV